jgi:hypothetical protein
MAKKSTPFPSPEKAMANLDRVSKKIGIKDGQTALDMMGVSAPQKKLDQSKVAPNRALEPSRSVGSGPSMGARPAPMPTATPKFGGDPGIIKTIPGPNRDPGIIKTIPGPNRDPGFGVKTLPSKPTDPGFGKKTSPSKPIDPGFSKPAPKPKRIG